jgi:hypothetical protein
MKMKRTVVIGVLSLACGICGATTARAEGDAVVDNSKKSRVVYATKDEAKDYRVTDRSEKRKQPSAKNVYLRPRLAQTQEFHKNRLPWAPNAPGD